MESKLTPAIVGNKSLKGKAVSNLRFTDNFDVLITFNETGTDGNLKIGMFQAEIKFATTSGNEKDILIYEYFSRFLERNYLHLRIDSKSEDTFFGQTVQGGFDPGGSTFTVEVTDIEEA